MIGSENRKRLGSEMFILPKTESESKMFIFIRKILFWDYIGMKEKLMIRIILSSII